MGAERGVDGSERCLVRANSLDEVKIQKRKIHASTIGQETHDEPMDEALKAKFNSIRRKLDTEDPPVSLRNNSDKFNKRCLNQRDRPLSLEELTEAQKAVKAEFHVDGILDQEKLPHFPSKNNSVERRLRDRPLSLEVLTEAQKAVKAKFHGDGISDQEKPPLKNNSAELCLDQPTEGDSSSSGDEEPGSSGNSSDVTSSDEAISTTSSHDELLGELTETLKANLDGMTRRIDSEKPHPVPSRNKSAKRHLDQRERSLSVLTETLKATLNEFRRRIEPEKPSPVSSINNSNKRHQNQVREGNQASTSRKKEDVDALNEPDFDHFADFDCVLHYANLLDDAEVQKRKKRASNIREETYRGVKTFYRGYIPQLFEYAVLVGLRSWSAGQGYEPYIRHKFPQDVDSNASIPFFCFPDAFDYKPKKKMKSETYTFVLTNSDGERFYGYCKRLLAKDTSLPEVICIISPVDSSSMYNALLYEIEVRRMINIEQAKEILTAAFCQPLPKPGNDVQILCLNGNSEKDTVCLKRPPDGRIDNVNYNCLLTYLGTDKLVKVFSSLIIERRVILHSRSLNCVTQVIKAVVALLYPFQWQHGFIPILPNSMLDVCCSPTPYLIGLLTSQTNAVLNMPLDEVIIVDLDKKNIRTSVGDESTILPSKITKALKMAINMACKNDKEDQRSQALMISEAFLRVFEETVGQFEEFIDTKPDGRKIFLEDNFIKKQESCELQQFLVWFTETTMFNVFISHHLEKREWGTFAVECPWSALKDPIPKSSPVLDDLSEETRDEWEIPRETLTLEKQLGAGYFGEVWKGKYANKTDVAIKKLNIGTMEAEAFLAEAQIMKECRHDKLVRLYAVCTKEEPMYIVTELISNGSLLEYLRNGSNQLDMHTLIDMAAQIACGMSYLEAKKFIHRDLAARNILVGDNSEVKVADFGLAKAIPDGVYTKQGGAFSCKWTAPEAGLQGKFTVKSDVWSYGVLIIELWSKGSVPYPGMPNHEVLNKVEDGYRMPKPKDCPKPVYEIVRKCWNKNAEARPTFEYLLNYFGDYYIYNEPIKTRKIDAL